MDESRKTATQKHMNEKGLIDLKGEKPYVRGDTHNEPQFQETKNGSKGTPCSGIFMRERELADGASKLTQEEIALLEFDIFKPLDFNEILFNRMKSGEYQGRTITSLNEL